MFLLQAVVEERERVFDSSSQKYTSLTAVLSLCRLVTLKVLNSIVLLGKSCVYVKRANMEDKLFERPSTAPSSSAKSPNKADQATCPTPSGKALTT